MFFDGAFNRCFGVSFHDVLVMFARCVSCLLKMAFVILACFS